MTSSDIDNIWIGLNRDLGFCLGVRSNRRFAIDARRRAALAYVDVLSAFHFGNLDLRVRHDDGDGPRVDGRGRRLGTISR